MKKLLLYIVAVFATSVLSTADAQTLRHASEIKAESPAMIADARLTMPGLHAPVDNKFISDKNDDSVDELAAELLGYADSFRGVRYRSGGKTPKGFDCSGFTSYVFKEFGYNLSNSSASQYSDGHAVDKSEIQAGDLVFFTGRASKSSRIGHVGIAISADPVTGVVTFIHASVSGGIKVDRTDAPYYAARFVGARRVLPD